MAQAIRGFIMAFKEIVAPTMRELFINQLVGMILSGELRPGDRLPTERELAEKMRISKTVVHDGVRELHRLGFLDIMTRKGITVADYAQTGTLDTLMTIMRYHGGFMDTKTANSLLKVRLYLEGPAFEELAENHTQEDMDKLEALERAAEETAHEGPQALAEALFQYHRAVAFLSGNSLTPLIMNAFAPASLEFWRRYIQDCGAEACLETLREFTQCIREKDGVRACTILREGIEEFQLRTGKL